jgi:hypothetical protein
MSKTSSVTPDDLDRQTFEQWNRRIADLITRIESVRDACAPFARQGDAESIAQVAQCDQQLAEVVTFRERLVDNYTHRGTDDEPADVRAWWEQQRAERAAENSRRSS